MRLGLGRVPADPTVRLAQPAVPHPVDLSGRGQLVQQRGRVARHPGGQDHRLDRAGRHRVAGQLLDRSEDRIGAAGRGPDSLPLGQEPGVRHLLDRLDPLAQQGQRAALDQRQHLGVAVLPFPAEVARLVDEGAGDQRAGTDEGFAGLLDHGAAQSVPLSQRRHHERSMGAGPAQHQIGDRVGDRLGEARRHSRRDRDAEPVTEPGHVLGHRGHLLPRDPDPDHPPVGDQLLEGRSRVEARHAARVQLRLGERTGGAEQVEQRLRASRPGARH